METAVLPSCMNNLTSSSCLVLLLLRHFLDGLQSGSESHVYNYIGCKNKSKISHISCSTQLLLYQLVIPPLSKLPSNLLLLKIPPYRLHISIEPLDERGTCGFQQLSACPKSHIFGIGLIYCSFWL